MTDDCLPGGGIAVVVSNPNDFVIYMIVSKSMTRREDGSHRQRSYRCGHRALLPVRRPPGSSRRFPARRHPRPVERTTAGMKGGKKAARTAWRCKWVDLPKSFVNSDRRGSSSVPQTRSSSGDAAAFVRRYFGRRYGRATPVSWRQAYLFRRRTCPLVLPIVESRRVQ